MNPTNPANTNPTTTLPPPSAPAATAMRYYYKELWGNFWYIGGEAVDFEQLDGNRGVGKFPEGHKWIAGLDQAAKDQVGGIVKISAEEYELKKNHFPLREKRSEMLAVAPRQDQQPKKPGAFIPKPPESPQSVALADGTTGEKPAALPPGEAPQRPPDQPDFRPTGTPKFIPSTARAGTGKAQEPSPV